jgi:exoribonuclease R
LVPLYHLLTRLSLHSKDYEKIKKEIEKEITELKVKMEDSKNDLILKDLELYALGKLPHTKNDIIHEKYLKPLKLEHTMKSAYKLCLDSKIFQHENIHLLRSPFVFDFPKEILIEAKNMKERIESIPDLDSHIRRDLKHLKSFAIDDKSTVDVDDAISILKFNLFFRC